MNKVGIILGSAMLADPDYKKYRSKVVKTKYGKIELKIDKNVFYLQRHGKNTPPHMINHQANIFLLHKQGVENIIALNSSASVKKDIKPGTILIPHDYIDWQNQYTFFDDKIKFTIPSISNELRNIVIKVGRQNNMQIIKKGVYWQVHGPRFETKTEIKLIAKFADIVGMTLASEATLARELDINYASICTVDNYANGISQEKCTIEKFFQGQRRSKDDVKRLLRETLKKI